jgi:hypothetical protein
METFSPRRKMKKTIPLKEVLLKFEREIVSILSMS